MTIFWPTITIIPRSSVPGGADLAVRRKLLKRLAHDIDAFGPKLGFGVPVAEWIGARPGLGRLVASQPGVREICWSNVVHDVFGSCDEKASYPKGMLLFYALWHHIHALGHAPGPSPEETLAQC